MRKNKLWAGGEGESGELKGRGRKPPEKMISNSEKKRVRTGSKKGEISHLYSKKLPDVRGHHRGSKKRELVCKKSMKEGRRNSKGPGFRKRSAGSKVGKDLYDLWKEGDIWENQEKAKTSGRQSSVPSKTELID